MRPLTARSHDHDPVWSPTGRRLALLARRNGDGKPQVHMLREDGGKARRERRGLSGISEVVSLPDGNGLTALARREHPEPETVDLWKAFEAARAVMAEDPSHREVGVRPASRTGTTASTQTPTTAGMWGAFGWMPGRISPRG